MQHERLHGNILGSFEWAWLDLEMLSLRDGDAMSYVYDHECVHDGYRFMTQMVVADEFATPAKYCELCESKIPVSKIVNREIKFSYFGDPEIWR